MRIILVLTRVLPALAIISLGVEATTAGEAFTITEAINEAVKSNPGVGEAAANRRATESGLRQSQSVLLPQVRIEANTGRDRFNQLDVAPPPLGNNTSLRSSEASVVVRQLLFDGFASLNEIWRQAARVDAAAYRTHERTELIALDAAEAYIDVIRFTRLITVARDNLGAHRRLLSNVEARFRGGRSGEGDLQQVRERVASAEATVAEFQTSLDQARATYRKVIGLEPFNLRAPGRLGAMPASRDDALATALRFNPTIQAAQADATAAKYAFKGTAGSFMPTVALEGRAMAGKNTNEIFGRQSDESAKVVLSWDIFRGGMDSWKRVEMAERFNEATMAHARLQRAAFESLDKAWSARTLTSDRIGALIRQTNFDRKAIDAYTKEYELGQRSLIDLLNSENQLYVALISLESSRAVAVLADYQLLAAMGQLLSYLKTPVPIDAAPLETVPFAIFPTKIAPIMLTLPKTGSEPLKTAPPQPYASVPAYAGAPMKYAAEPAADIISRRWSDSTTLPDPSRWAAPQMGDQAARSDAVDPGWASRMMSVPLPAH